MDFPENLLYTKTHEWVKKEEKNMARIGITSYAQSQLGDVFSVELPALDSSITGRGVKSLQVVRECKIAKIQALIYKEL